MGEPKSNKDYWSKVKQKISKLTSVNNTKTCDSETESYFTNIPQNIVYVQPYNEVSATRRSSIASYCSVNGLWYNLEQPKPDQFGSIVFNEHSVNETNCVKIPTNRDGDCLFTSTAFFLKRQYQDNDLPIEFLKELTNKKVFLYEDLPSIAFELRQLTVKEWVDNEDKYRAFLPEHTSEEYVCSAYWFAMKGTHRGLLEDTAPLALANALQISFRILLSDFTGSYRVLPFVDFNSTFSFPTVYLMLNPNGNGHYDAVLLKKPKLEFPFTSYNTVVPMPSVVHP